MNGKLIDFLLEAGKLKATVRTGWLKHGIRQPESVADHSWRTALIALTLAKRLKLDVDKTVKMALIHDLAEARTGDIIRGTIEKKHKHKMEADALRKITKNLDSSAAKEITRLWEEFESNTDEALLVQDCDNLDMMLQALEYEKSQGNNLEDFYKNGFHFPETEALAQAIKARRTPAKS